MEIALGCSGKRVRVIEDCLNGRRTVWEDPFRAGRNGLTGLAQRIEINAPLALVILMLGTNDFQSTRERDAWLSSQGIGSLISAIRAAPIEPGMSAPQILVVAPPEIRAAKGPLAAKFKDAEIKSAGLASAYKKVSEEAGCHFFDAASVVTTCQADGVHLDVGDHAILGKELSQRVDALLTGG